jgi:hypothetical protein
MWLATFSAVWVIVFACTGALSQDAPPQDTGEAESTLVAVPIPACSMATAASCSADAANSETIDVPQPVALVWQDLAMNLGVDPTLVQVVSIQDAIWPDTCLGLPSPELCIFGETPGYRVVLSAFGQEYTYHTDQLELFRYEGPGDRPLAP